ncbi:MAG: hypothetical protein JO131_01730, partial [Gammaproteobacteria bacterium]|nr:hypothetical protein [Gammaproteobacteria bacterium]
SEQYKLYQCAKRLNLIDESPWPAEKKVNHVILQGSIEKFIINRVNFIQPFQGNIYFFSGPPGADNSAIATPSIIADWFNMPQKVDVIGKFLGEHSKPTDHLQWNQKLSLLKRKLVKLVGAKEWPKALNSYYYQHKNIYDAYADNAKRERLDCEGGPWPVAADIAFYYIKKRFQQEIEDKNMNFIPVISLGKSNALTTMEDIFEEWFEHIGKAIMHARENVLIVWCNGMHSLPFVNYRLVHNELYQQALTATNLTYKLKQFNSLQSYQSINYKEISWPIVGPGATELNVHIMLDSIAKSIFQIQRKNPCLINYYRSVEEDSFAKTMSAFSGITLAKRMIWYSKADEDVLLTNAIVDFALYFYRLKDLIKTSGLFNVALNVLKKTNPKNTQLLSVILNNSILVNMMHFILLALKSLKYPVPQLDVLLLKLLIKESKEKLFQIRKETFVLFKNVSPNNSQHIMTINKFIFEKIRKFYLSLIHTSITLLGRPFKEFAIAYMGSNARVQATPYSDIESLMIIKNVKDHAYAKKIIQLTLISILNLGETIVFNLGISVLDKYGKPFTLNGEFFDKWTPDGLSYDSNNPGAQKTPLGRKNLYSLIGPPKLLSEIFSSDTGFHLHQWLPHVIRLTRFAGGKRELYNELIDGLKHSKFNFRAYTLALLSKEIDVYTKCFEQINYFTLVNHKKYCFRPVNTILDNFFVAIGIVKNIDSYKKIEFLYNHKIINMEQYDILINNLNYVLYLRLQQHFKYNEQKILFSNKDGYFNYFIQSQSLVDSFLIQLKETLIQNESYIVTKEASLTTTYHLRLFNNYHKSSQLLIEQQLPLNDRSFRKFKI